MTIKENILFGCEFDPERYEQVIYACALNEVDPYTHVFYPIE